MLNFIGSPLSFLFSIIALLVAITIHEYAHAWSADYLGDPTPRLAGRLTLNPFAHLDPLGTLALFLVNFGWGKPVPVDSFNFRNPRRDEALVSLSGPLSNFITAIIASLFLKAIFLFNLNSIGIIAQIFPVLYTFIQTFVLLNLALGFFNLIPLPPLDGEKILLGIVPRDLALKIEDVLDQYGMILLILIILPLGNQGPLVSAFLSPLINFLMQLLI